MNSKSMAQLLIPFAATLLLFIAFFVITMILFWIGWLLSGGRTDHILVEIARFLGPDIFKFDRPGTIFFWIVDLAIIIFAEMVVTNDE